MVFQPKGWQNGNTQTFDMNSLVDQIADAVRKRLGNAAPTGQASAPETQSPPSQTASSGSPSWRHLLSHGADRVASGCQGPFEPHLLQGDEALARQIDHTLLKPEATKEEVERLCDEARKFHFATVCVNSSYVGLAAELLKGSSTKAIAVVGFPLGAAATATKAFEAREAVRNGAQEIDMVINIGALKNRDYALVLEDIRKVVEASLPYPLKVILETSALTLEEKIIGSALSKAAGAAFVKTSTGFGSGGATAEDIALMRKVVGPEMGVKASGGIRSYEDASKMIAAGANRIGASASIAIVMHKTDDKSGDKKPGAGNKKPFKNSLY